MGLRNPCVLFFRFVFFFFPQNLCIQIGSPCDVVRWRRYLILLRFIFCLFDMRDNFPGLTRFSERKLMSYWYSQKR